MKADIVLEDCIAGLRIIIDTKFTEIVQSGWHREVSLKSAYIYQIYSYLRSQDQPEDPISNRSIGILLHPSIGFEYNEAVGLQGHIIRFMTVDLTSHSSEIKKCLLTVLEPPKDLITNKRFRII